MRSKQSKSFVIAAIIYDIIGTIMLIIFYNSVYERPVDESTILENNKLGLWERLVNIFGISSVQSRIDLIGLMY